MPTPLQVLIVDDHKLFTAGLAAVIGLLPRPVDVRELDNARAALSALESGRRYDLLLVDIEMPTMSGIDFLDALRHRDVEARVVVVSATDDDALIERAMAAGARGFFPKSLSPALMVPAIETVLAGERYLPEHLRERVRLAPRSDAAADPAFPNARQHEILGMLERGLTNQQIADVLDLSVSTIKFHLSALFRELNVRTRTECVHVARERRLID